LCLILPIVSAGIGPNQLSNPYGIWRDVSSDILYIADSYNHRIMRYQNNAPSGDIAAGGNGPGTNSSQLSYPYAFYFDSLSNSLLIANAGANNIVRWVLGASNWVIVAGNSGGSSGNTATFLTSPTDVALDPMGNVYVVDMWNQRIQFFPSGQLNGITIAGVTGVIGNNTTLLNYPSSLALDGQLNLYVVDESNNRIQKFIRY
jgi:sugar lactone lactonase YvrE